MILIIVQNQETVNGDVYDSLLSIRLDLVICLNQSSDIGIGSSHNQNHRQRHINKVSILNRVHDLLTDGRTVVLLKYSKDNHETSYNANETKHGNLIANKFVLLNHDEISLFVVRVSIYTVI